jgi:hypothetical protein
MPLPNDDEMAREFVSLSESDPELYGELVQNPSHPFVPADQRHHFLRSIANPIDNGFWVLSGEAQDWVRSHIDN